MRAIPLVLVLFLLAFGCGSAPPEAAPDNGIDAVPVNVSVVKLEPSSITESIVLAGTLDPWLEVTVSTELGGTVEEIGFEKGRWVERGQVLARVGSDLFAAALEEAEAELAAAEAELKKTSELFDRQAVPRQDLIAATSRHKMSAARVAQAKLRHDRSVLEAPISGVAVDREAEPGEVLAPGARITTLHQIHRLKARVGIPENDISFFRQGGAATLEVDAYPGRSFTGRIHFLGPAATGKNRTFPAEIEIANTRGDLRPGMIARVTLTKRRMEGVLVVPRDALLERQTGTAAFVLDGDRARLRAVSLGPSEGNRVAAVEGLSPGEWLIVTGQRNLVDGQLVRVVEWD